MFLSSLLGMQGAHKEIGRVRCDHHLRPSKYTLNKRELIHHYQVDDNSVPSYGGQPVVSSTGNGCSFFYGCFIVFVLFFWSTTSSKFMYGSR